MLFGVDVSCRISYCIICYIYVGCSGSIRLGKRELICVLSFTCNYVVSVRRDFLFLLVLGISCVILLWHSMGFPCNYFVCLMFIQINNSNLSTEYFIRHSQ